MQILIIATSYYSHIGGVEYVVKSTTERLVRKGHNVTAIAGYPAGKTSPAGGHKRRGGLSLGAESCSSLRRGLPMALHLMCSNDYISVPVHRHAPGGGVCAFARVASGA
jgi:hypothetical protein